MSTAFPLSHQRQATDDEIANQTLQGVPLEDAEEEALARWREKQMRNWQGDKRPVTNEKLRNAYRDTNPPAFGGGQGRSAEEVAKSSDTFWNVLGWIVLVMAIAGAVAGYLIGR